MQHEDIIQKKKIYAAPTMEVVEFEHQVSLLEGSNDLPKYKTCDNCIFD